MYKHSLLGYMLINIARARAFLFLSSSLDLVTCVAIAAGWMLVALVSLSAE